MSASKKCGKIKGVSVPPKEDNWDGGEHSITPGPSQVLVPAQNSKYFFKNSPGHSGTLCEAPEGPGDCGGNTLGGGNSMQLWPLAADGPGMQLIPDQWYITLVCMQKIPSVISPGRPRKVPSRKAQRIAISHCRQQINSLVLFKAALYIPIILI